MFAEWDVNKAYLLVWLSRILPLSIVFMAAEQMTILQVIGVALICVGSFMVGWS